MKKKKTTVSAKDLQTKAVKRVSRDEFAQMPKSKNIDSKKKYNRREQGSKSRAFFKGSKYGDYLEPLKVLFC